MVLRIRPPTPEEAIVFGHRTREARTHFPIREFARRIDGMCHAMDGGLWLHFHLWYERPLAHLVSADRALLLAYGAFVGIPEERLQDKPLRDPRSRERRPAWHWDLGGPLLPPRLGPAAGEPGEPGVTWPREADGDAASERRFEPPRFFP